MTQFYKRDLNKTDTYNSGTNERRISLAKSHTAYSDIDRDYRTHQISLFNLQCCNR